MKMKAIIPLALGVVVGLVAIKFLVDTVQRAKGEPAETVTTFVAKTDIPASIELSAEMLARVETPKSPLVPEGAFTSPDELIGRVTSKSIPQGSVISPLSLAPPGTPPGLTERIDEGFRAVSVKIDEVSGVAGQVRPDDFVDVIVVMKVKHGRKTDTIARIILQKVKVIAVGQNLASQTQADAASLARSITLLVRDLDVPKLHLAQTQGKITLAMRGVDDRLIPEAGRVSSLDWEETPEDQQDDPSSAPADTLLASAAPFAPKASQLYAVTVINGPLRRDGATAIQHVTYENRNSMKVVSIETNRGGQSQADAADGGETVTRSRRGVEPYDDDAQPYSRDDQRSGEYEQPPDREIDQE
ncbi:MAG TPA: Flp pilus assembly protein CpaB [Phycisphaerae bacterium]|nr:Flp pilus assembly protein CpaB [Phycisphaerae bacterium]